MYNKYNIYIYVLYYIYNIIYIILYIYIYYIIYIIIYMCVWTSWATINFLFWDMSTHLIHPADCHVGCQVCEGLARAWCPCNKARQHCKPSRTPPDNWTTMSRTQLVPSELIWFLSKQTATFLAFETGLRFSATEFSMTEWGALGRQCKKMFSYWQLLLFHVQSGPYML